MVINKSIQYSIVLIRNLKFGNFEKLNQRLNIRAMSTKSNNSDVVLHDVVNNKGILTLNRTDKLNVLNFPAVNIIFQKLLEWESKVDMVVVKGEGRAFCAGGDVVNVIHLGSKKDGKDFFRTKYTMDGYINQYPVPYVALIDGITMGSGVGLSVHGQVRVATERTMFSMPETLIGFFPDVGVTYVLSRMPNHLGHFLGLTGYRLNGTDVAKIGIATHYTKSENIPKLLQGLIELKEPKKNLNNFLLKNTEDVSECKFSLEPHLELIERAFSAPSVEEIIQRLQDDGSPFALQTIETLNRMSPTALKISKKIADMYKYLSLNECLTIDNRLAASAVDSRVTSDFYEGTRALLVDKDKNPKWNPATLEEVTDDMVEKVFGVLPPEEEINLINRHSQLRDILRSKI